MVDPDSRFPERRAVLAPFEGAQSDEWPAATRGSHVAISVGAAMTAEPPLLDGREVDAVRESWLIEDRWWTERPLRRRYWEVVTTCGRDEVVFRDLAGGRWWRQR